MPRKLPDPIRVFVWVVLPLYWLACLYLIAITLISIYGGTPR